MSKRDVNRLRMYDRDIADYDLFNSLDDELIEIASPPLKIYALDFESMAPLDDDLIDDVYGEQAMFDYEKIKQIYGRGDDVINENGLELSIDDFNVVHPGELFKMYVTVPGYYQEPTWAQELTRLGVQDLEEELAITFNYDTLKSKIGDTAMRENLLGYVIQTFRGDVYRVVQGYQADETVGWKYIHYHVIAKKPDPGTLGNLLLPDNPYIPGRARGGK